MKPLRGIVLWTMLVLTAATAWLAAQQPAALTFDILIRNGRVLDGSGNPWYRADIGIIGERIAAVGALGTAKAKTAVDAKDRFVSPGFIDVHSHAGPGLATEQLKHGQPVLAQGITTVLVNPDGGGPIDLAAQRATYDKQRIGLNVGLFVPHGSIRQEVMGMSDRDPDAAALEKMVALTRAGMQAGGVGLSSGLYYAPGSYSKTAEVVAMAKATAPFGGVYSSHIRDEADYTIGVVAAVDEVITIAEQAGVVGVVSHMKALGPASWGLSKTLVQHIEAARTRGVQVLADQYAYEASGTGIVGALMPRSAQVGGREAMMKRVTGELRGEIRAQVKDNIARRGGADTLMISRYRPDPSLEGQRLSDLAAKAGVPPEEYALQLLEKGDASLVSFNMSEDDIELIMRQPWTMTCTDGDLVEMGVGKPHPRAYGAFARKLKRYVRERNTIDIATAIRTMTSLPAAVFGLKDRGQLRTGAFADLLIFDLSQVNDAATYQDPHRLSEGFIDIMVNGQWARRDNQFTTALAGQVLRPAR
ncbi:MAG TPA: amidohydrolase family protein [Vicinamibacterales bacterium]|nr:amidohydrolase family protein [Vicinamibacterales bacterium]